MSNASAASPCMRYASSNDWIRASSRRIVRAGRGMSLVEPCEPGRAAAAALPESIASLRMFSISFSMSVCWVSMYVPW